MEVYIIQYLYNSIFLLSFTKYNIMTIIIIITTTFFALLLFEEFVIVAL